MVNDDKPIRVSVVGAGYFGRYHAEKLAHMPGVELTAIADIEPRRARKLANEYGAEAASGHQELAENIDAVTIAVPTSQHHTVASFFLDRGIHTFVEKPITDNLADAEDMVRRARANGAILQVGHIERFSGLYRALRMEVRNPLFIESVRIAPFKARGTDISVVLDVMIHDIDLILGIVNQPVDRVDAVGAPVFSDSDDIANTRITFANGCVANLTASRISLKQERRMRIFQPDCYISIDFDQKSLRVVRRSEKTDAMRPFPVDIREVGYEEVDSLAVELQSFVDCVRTGGTPVVTGEDGRAALETALTVSESLYGHRQRVEREGLLRTVL